MIPGLSYSEGIDMRILAFASLFNLLLAVAAWGAVAGPLSTRFAPPTAAEQEKSRKLIDEIYRKPLAQAKNDQAKAEIGRQMLQAGIETRNDPAGRFTVLTCAMETATESGDLNTALRAIDELEGNWDLDGLRMRADVLLTLQKLLRRPEDLVLWNGPPA